MARHLDLLGGCNDRGAPMGEFKSTFCQRCRNPDCIHAKWAGSTWVDRIGTQVDRLLVNPHQANPNDPRFESVRRPSFLTLEPPIQQASQTP